MDPDIHGYIFRPLAGLALFSFLPLSPTILDGMFAKTMPDSGPLLSYPTTPCGISQNEVKCKVLLYSLDAPRPLQLQKLQKPGGRDFELFLFQQLPGAGLGNIEGKWWCVRRRRQYFSKVGRSCIS